MGADLLECEGDVFTDRQVGVLGVVGTFGQEDFHEGRHAGSSRGTELGQCMGGAYSGTPTALLEQLNESWKTLEPLRVDLRERLNRDLVWNDIGWIEIDVEQLDQMRNCRGRARPQVAQSIDRGLWILIGRLEQGGHHERRVGVDSGQGDDRRSPEIGRSSWVFQDGREILGSRARARTDGSERIHREDAVVGIVAGKSLNEQGHRRLTDRREGDDQRCTDTPLVFTVRECGLEKPGQGRGRRPGCGADVPEGHDQIEGIPGATPHGGIKLGDQRRHGGFRVGPDRTQGVYQNDLVRLRLAPSALTRLETAGRPIRTRAKRLARRSSGSDGFSRNRLKSSETAPWAGGPISPSAIVAA